MSQFKIITAQPWQFDVSSSFFHEEFLYLFFRMRATKDLNSFGLLKISRQNPYDPISFMISKEITPDAQLEHTAQIKGLNSQAAHFTFTRTIQPSERPDSWYPEEVFIHFDLMNEKWRSDHKENRNMENILPKGRLISAPFDRKQGQISFRWGNSIHPVPVTEIIQKDLDPETIVNTNFLFLPQDGPHTAFVLALARAKSTAKKIQGNYEVLIAAEV